jgi:hypothetical protein
MRDIHSSSGTPSAVNRLLLSRTIEPTVRRLQAHPDRCRTHEKVREIPEEDS